MRRSSFLVAAALVILAALSQSGTDAHSESFAERFASADKVKMGDSGAYNFDKAHTFIGFKVRHTGLIEVPGFFRDFTGTVNFDNTDVTKSSVEFAAKATSVDTGVQGRDNHLRSKDFFEVQTYPDITFKSTKIEKKGKGWLMTGDLTMKAVTKSITFPFQILGWLPADERSGGKMGIAAETTINRREFGVNYDNKLPSGVPAVSDDVKIVLQIEAGKRKDAAKSE